MQASKITPPAWGVPSESKALEQRCEVDSGGPRKLDLVDASQSLYVAARLPVACYVCHLMVSVLLCGCNPMRTGRPARVVHAALAVSPQMMLTRLAEAWHS